MESRDILDVRVDATSYPRASAQILAWSRETRSRYVCLGTVNHIMEARESVEFAAIMRDANLVTADGMPLVWLLRRLGVPNASRVYGPDLTAVVLQAAEENQVPVGFYGGSEQVLAKLVESIQKRFAQLQIVYAVAPPFRALTPEEDEEVVRAIRSSGARILFVGLGTPKQDRWMHAHQGRFGAVMLGVGAAFDFLAGAKPQAPRWMQRSGLEWLFRLCAEPARLGPRYLSQNPRFAFLALRQLIRARFDEHRRPA